MSQVTVITGRDRRRKWGSDERRRVLEAVFAPGAVIAQVARQFDVASSMIYKWRHEALAANNKLAFVPAVLTEPEPVPAASAPSSLVTATLLALQ